MNSKQIVQDAEKEIHLLIQKKIQEIQEKTGFVVSRVDVDLVIETTAVQEKAVLLGVNINLD
jgi:hypothetical protein